jgi:hypothetical protein
LLKYLTQFPKTGCEQINIIYPQKGGDEHGRQKGRLWLRMCWAKTEKHESYKEKKRAQKVQVTNG